MDHDAFILLCVTSIRRLLTLRHGQHGADAREAIHQWISDLRKLKA